MSGSGIKFDYNQTVNQANIIKDAATDMQSRCCKALGDITGSIEASWTGDSGKKFHNYLVRVHEDLEKQAKFLHDTSEFLIEAAQKMKQAEEAAKQSAQGL